MNFVTSTLWGEQTKIEDMIANHLELVVKTIDKFGEGMTSWVKEGDLEKANQLAFETHKLEGEADDKRREIEKKLIGGALLARSRSEMLDLIERTDKLANASEAAMDFTLLQQIRIPDQLQEEVLEIVQISLDIVGDVQSGLLDLFDGSGDTLEFTTSIEHQEGEVDNLERDYIQELFEMDDKELAEKILLRQFMENLVEISDRAEDLSDQMEILVATRKA